MSTPILEPTGPSDQPAPRCLWTRRDLAVGLCMLVLWRSLGFANAEWFAGVSPWLMLVAVLVLPELFLLGFPTFLAWRRGNTQAFGRLGLKRLLWEAGLAIPIFVGVFLLLVAAGFLINEFWPETPVAPGGWQGLTRTSNIPFAVSILVLSFTLVPICEEVFFRGFLHRALRSRMPTAAAAVIQSAVFALAHDYGWVNGVAVFFMGLILTAVYEWRRSLAAPIFVHAANNLLFAVFLLLAVLANANAPVLGIVGSDHADGCHIDEVLPAAAAAEAGILPGDVIVELGNERIESFPNLVETLRGHQIDDRIPVVILRNGEYIVVEATLQGRP